MEIQLTGADGATDTVHTYFGLRTIRRGKHGELPHEVFLLNNEPIYLRGALDQSLNADGIYTAPSDEFIRRDLQIAKDAGFNFLRIQVKAEEPRRLYWADRLGL
ncbi:MAG: glycoside hydrolase family 2, partial [Planctomycetales bacterium]|nr:glycoside hydrolase family 2 [Planctomycetales bacterium]